MKRAFFIIGVVGLTATLGLGQKHKTSESQEPAVKESSSERSGGKTKAPLVNAGQSGSASATGTAAVTAGGQTLNAGTALAAALQSSLDVRRSKVGDRVVLKTLRAVKQNGQTLVPRGTQLVGRVTEVAQRGKNNAESRIGMIFDRIEGNNLSQPISASIVSITSAATSVSAGDDLFSSDLMGSSSNSGSVSRGSGSSGLIGGATNSIGNLANTATGTVGGVTDTATRALGGTTQGVGSTLSGLRISGGASGTANGSTTVSSGDKNLHIDKGATFNLRVNN